MTTKDKYRGCLLGLAAGDALGTTLEFRPPGSFDPIDDLVGGGPFGLEPGQWTDDTSMALCLAESLVETGGFDPVDQLKRYVSWYRDGHLSSTGVAFDIGNTCLSAIERFEDTGEPYCGSEDPWTAGNGSLMRLAPVPLFFGANPREAIEKSADSSRTTHGARAAVDACRYFAGLLAGALNGEAKSALLADHYCPVDGYWDEHPLVEEIAEIAAGSFREKEPPDIRGTGYVAETLEAALWAFYKGRDFREGVLLAVNLGDDADTTGAIYGQLGGAFYGGSSIPESWREKLAKRQLIEHLAEKL
ncbi:MAG: ADP-ribosylglycohydrolase family protein, partial [Planctomycetia bacterium]|nr:ADP-ribosylglycohydrolase family protein [Planctomycetia bacterium]